MRAWSGDQPIKDTREYSLKDVATGLGVHYQTALEWAQAKKLRSRRNKATKYQYRVQGCDLRAYIDQANAR